MKISNYIPYAVGLIVIYIIYKQISGSRPKVKAREIDNMDIFNKQKCLELNNKYPNAKKLSSVEIQILAKRIYDAKGFFNDDENAVYSVFQSIPYKSYICQLTVAFESLYNKNLINYLDFLNNDEKAKIFDYINKMKNGY